MELSYLNADFLFLNLDQHLVSLYLGTELDLVLCFVTVTLILLDLLTGLKDKIFKIGVLYIFDLFDKLTYQVKCSQA